MGRTQLSPQRLSETKKTNIGRIIIFCEGKTEKYYFDYFAEIIKKRVTERLGDECYVSIHKVDKNNRVTYTGLQVQKEGANLSPIIYLDSQYRNFLCKQITLPEVVDYVVKTAKGKSQQVDMRLFLNFSSIKDSIVYSLINTERNRELLEDLPHMDFMDLSIVFQSMLVRVT